MSGTFRGFVRTNQQTIKVIRWLIRNYCAKNVPLAVIVVAVQFAGQIRAQFSNSNCHCISTADNFQTLTLICNIREHLPIVCRGTLAASTQFGMYRWILQLNKYSKHMIIGVSQFPWNNGFVALTIDVDAHWSMSGFKVSKTRTKSRRFKKNPPADVEDGDKVKIIIHKEKIGFEVFNDEGVKWQFSYKIDPGKYKLFVTLEKVSDSVSIIDYTQLM